MRSISQYIKEAIISKLKFVDAIIRYQDEYLFLRRANYMKLYPGKWALVGGHIDNGESPESSIVREIEEETGIKIGSQMMQSKDYKYSDGDVTKVFFVNLTEKPEIKISREHAQYKWMTINDYHTMRHKFPVETQELIDNMLSLDINEGKTKEYINKDEIKFTIWEKPDTKVKWLKDNESYQKIEYKYKDKKKDIEADFLLGYKNNSWQLWAGKIGALTYDDDPYYDFKTKDFSEAIMKSLDKIEEIVKDIKEDPTNNVQYYVHM